MEFNYLNITFTNECGRHLHWSPVRYTLLTYGANCNLEISFCVTVQSWSCLQSALKLNRFHWFKQPKHKVLHMSYRIKHVLLFWLDLSLSWTVDYFSLIDVWFVLYQFFFGQNAFLRNISFCRSIEKMVKMFCISAKIHYQNTFHQ